MASSMCTKTIESSFVVVLKFARVVNDASIYVNNVVGQEVGSQVKSSLSISIKCTVFDKSPINHP